MNRPSVIVKSKFIASGKKSFKNYINYIDRKDTHSKKNHKNEFKNYQNYMNDEEKSTGLFTKELDFMSENDKEVYKDIFDKSQKNGSILWQDVISFDNEWLKEIGILNGKDIDEIKLKSATRSAMNELLKKEGTLHNSIWSAAIHYNTDNIHIHVATVQTFNYSERGKRKQKSINSMKSQVANILLDRSEENQKLNEFIRDKVINHKKNNSTYTLKNRLLNPELIKQISEIQKNLPKDKRQWNYNMTTMAHVKPEIDKFTDMYITKYFPKEYEEFKKNLDKEVAIFKRSYGENSSAENYKLNKINDLKQRFGNVVLKEIKELEKEKNTINQPKRNPFKIRNQTTRALNNLFYKVDHSMRDNLQSLKNMNEFEQNEREKNNQNMDYER